ncbi:MAG: ABC transporter ATP-binding protein [Armatimonadetes bacterium]|nr:ABC transporter ATP-binding protein [Armatimonadota bacterium]
MSQRPPLENPSLQRRLAQEARPYAPHLVALLFLELLATPVALLSPIPLQVAVDCVVHGRPVPGFLQWMLGSHPETPQDLLPGVCMVSLAIALLGQIRILLSTLLSTLTGQRLMLGFRSRLFRHAQELSISYHTNRTSTDALYRIQSDASAIESVLTDAAIPALSSAFTLVCMLVVLLRLDLRIGSIALVVTPLLFVLSRWSRPTLRARSRQIKEQESRALGVVQETLGLLPVVKVFGQQEREEKRFTTLAAQCVSARIRLSLLENSIGLCINMITAGGVALVFYVGISDVLKDALTLGQLLLVLSYVSELYTPLRTVSRKLVAVQAQMASLERAYTFLQEPPDVSQRPDALPIRRATGHIVFRGVGFDYGAARAALQDISFEVDPGERVGIVGATGSGKTTLTHLLLRIYDPTEGDIRLDGVDLRDYRVRDLRDQFAVVFQESLLLSGTIRENIAYGVPDAEPEEIEEAARAANVHHFISSLPDGYHTRVGERGMAVSGGERQRIALARAFLKNAPILILDEPTSSVDRETEAAVVDAIGCLSQGRTTFIIAHRLNTLQGCDLVLQIEEGRLVSFTRNPLAVRRQR